MVVPFPGEMVFSGKTIGAISTGVSTKSIFVGSLCTAVSFSNSTVVSLFSGYCRVGLFPYLAGSLIGFTPLTIIMCLFGSGGTGGRTLHLILGFVLIILLHLFTLILKKWLPMAAPHCSPRRSDDGSC